MPPRIHGRQKANLMTDPSAGITRIRLMGMISARRIRAPLS